MALLLTPREFATGAFVFRLARRVRDLGARVPFRGTDEAGVATGALVKARGHGGHGDGRSRRPGCLLVWRAIR